MSRGPNRRDASVQAARPKRVKWQTRGNFVGAFRKPSRKSGRGLEKFNKKGFVFVKENTGTVTDANVCYIMNQVVDPYTLLQQLNAAILRTLFEKVGMRVTGYDDYFPSGDNGATNRNEMTLELLTVNDRTGVASVGATIIWSATQTMRAICENAAVFAVMQSYCNGVTSPAGVGAAGNLEVPLKWILWSNEDAAANKQSFMGEILFDEIIITLYGKSELKVQNRTKASSGSGVEADDVSNNPLQGKLYTFKGIPRVKIQSQVLGQPVTHQFNLMQIDKNFVKTLTGAELIVKELQEPVPPGFFWNCSGCANVRLDPGQIKNSYVSQSVKLPILLLLKRMRLQFGPNAAPTFSVNYSIFKSQMIGLEDVINVNALELISVAFEIERTVAISASIKKKKYCKTSFDDKLYVP